MVEVRQYVDLAGRNRFARWFAEQPEVARARIVSTIERLESGNFSAMKGVHHGVYELRLDFGPGYRIYCGKEADKLVILLGGGTKKRQNVDIWAAQELWQEYKKRKREGTLHAGDERQ